MITAMKTRGRVVRRSDRVRGLNRKENRKVKKGSKDKEVGKGSVGRSTRHELTFSFCAPLETIPKGINFISSNSGNTSKQPLVLVYSCSSTARDTFTFKFSRW